MCCCLVLLIVDCISFITNFTITSMKSVLRQGRIQTFKKGSFTLELQLQPSCKLKTKKKRSSPADYSCSSCTNYTSFFITRYIACYTAPQKTTVTALLEYLDLTALLEYLEYERLFQKGGSMEPFEPPWIRPCTFVHL